MKTVELSEATGPPSELAEQAPHEAVAATERDRPVAALVPIDELDLESPSFGTHPDFLALIEQSRARCRPGAGLSTDEMRACLAARQAQT